jgi:hypothetical protein
MVAGVAGSNPSDEGMDVCLLCLYVVLSSVGRGLCDGLITRPGEFYRVSNCVSDHRTPERGPMFQLGTTGKWIMMNCSVNHSSHRRWPGAHKGSHGWLSFVFRHWLRELWLYCACVERNCVSSYISAVIRRVSFAVVCCMFLIFNNIGSTLF